MSISKCHDHLGLEYESKIAMCKAWGITYAAFASRMREGATLAEALTMQMRDSADAAKPGTMSRGRKRQTLDVWGLSSQDIEAIIDRVELPSSHIAKNHGKVWPKFEPAHICPRILETCAEARWYFGFTLKECALSPKAFKKLLLERFHV